jgi:hypothetical protein
MSLIAGAFTSNPDKQLPLQKLFEATMRGNGEMQAQAQVKKVAGDQMDSTSRMTVTMKPNPSGGVPLVTVKDAPADLLNQTREADVKNAYDAPRKNVEDRLKEYGFSPKTSDVQPTDVDSYSERYRARRELGGGVLKSAIMAGITGSHRDPQLIQNLKNQRAAQNLATEQKFIDPVRDQDMQEYEKGVIEPARLRAAASSESRQATGQYLTARNQLLDQKNVIQYGDEGSFVSDAEKAMQPVGGFKDGDRDLFARAFKTGRVSFLNDRVKALSGEEGKLAIDSYGDSPAEINRFVEEQAGVDPSSLSRAERTRLARTATGLIQYKKEKAQKEADAQRKMQQADERIAFAMREKPEKPRKMTSFDSTNASSDALLSAVGDPSFDQTSVKQAINDKAGKIKQRLSEIDAAMKGNATEHAKLAPIIYDEKGQIKPGSEQANPFIFTRVIDAENKGKKWQTEADSLKAELAKLSGTSSSQAASQGPPPVNQRVAGKTTYTFTSGPLSGKSGLWNGKSWDVQP